MRRFNTVIWDYSSVWKKGYCTVNFKVLAKGDIVPSHRCRIWVVESTFDTVPFNCALFDNVKAIVIPINCSAMMMMFAVSTFKVQTPRQQSKVQDQGELS